MNLRPLDLKVHVPSLDHCSPSNIYPEHKYTLVLYNNSILATEFITYLVPYTHFMTFQNEL